MSIPNSSASKEVVTAVIGSKNLSGRTKDQNIGYVADCLTVVGIDLKEVRVVGNEEKAIVDALNALRHRYTYVFTTGGIGPTHGDITADCVAKAFGVPIDTDPRALDILHEWVKATGAEMSEARLRMTRIPKGRGSHPQQGVRSAWLLDRQCNREWRACPRLCRRCSMRW
jgi:molybdopterin-biosynthesis enzyme MoeA-like protein